MPSMFVGAMRRKSSVLGSASASRMRSRATCMCPAFQAITMLHIRLSADDTSARDSLRLASSFRICPSWMALCSVRIDSPRFSTCWISPQGS